MTTVSGFLETHFRHFNARETLEAARSWRHHLEQGGKMMVALGGAMSTAEVGLSLARMIREEKVHAISCTAANLEEDVFNLLDHGQCRLVPRYRELTADDEVRLRDQGYNRVTDTCIPESIMRGVEYKLTEYWLEAAEAKRAYFPYEFIFRLVTDGWIEQHRTIPIEHSWIVAACEAGIPIYTPGWEDSTLGNMFTARVVDGTLPRHDVVKSGTSQMEHLIQWYDTTSRESPIGFFQVGGGISGDFAICVVPLLIQDLKKDCRLWSYFAQVSDAITSYGSYSGANPNEKITWFKLDRDCPKYMIQSDASIVCPLVFAYVLGD